MWGKCSDSMKARSEATTSKEQDTINLLKVVKQIMFCNDALSNTQGF